MDQDEQAPGPGEGVRIIGAQEAVPGESRRAAEARPAPAARPVRPATSWDDDDADQWDGWGDEEDDGPDPRWEGPAITRAPSARTSTDDDGETWSGAPRWRSENEDWDDAHDDELASWDDVRVGTLAAGRADESDLYTFDDPESGAPERRGAADDDDSPDDGREVAAIRFVDEDLPEPVRGRVTSNRRGPRPPVEDDEDDDPDPRRARAGSGGRPASRPANRRPSGSGPDRRQAPPTPRTPPPSSMGTRVVTGVALLAGLGVILAVGKARAGVLLVSIVLAIAVFELYTALRQRGFQPAILPGALATVLLPVAAYNRGANGILTVLVLTTLTTLLWYLIGVVRDRPAVNMAVTLLGVMYIGVLGSLAGWVLAVPKGISILLAAVLATVAYDVVGLFVGANLGQRALAPDISPNKTVEGLIGGVIGALVAAIVVFGKIPGVSPWDANFSATVILGIAVAVMAPLGDLTESMIKRDLGIKDMGTILPGHGGILDRIDAMLFTVPAVWCIARWKGWA